MSRFKSPAVRDCRPCTACCDGWVRIIVAGHEARPGSPSRALHWLKDFAQRQGRPLLYTEQVRAAGRFTGEQRVYGFGPPAFQEQAARWSADGTPW